MTIAKFELLLAVSALCLPAAAWAEDPVAPAAEADPGEQQTVVVQGRRQKESLEQEQVASPNAVAELNAAKIGQAPDQNLAESLARLPGVTVFNGGQGNTNGVATDIAGRGQGNYVVLRGMDAEYNVNLVNGVEGAQGMPFSRQVPLNLLPPTGMQRIVVNKTFLPTMDGTAIGGSIDFRTPTAADFSRRTELGVSLAGRFNSRASDYGQAADGESATAELVHKFGAGQQWGLYVSGYYDRTNFTNTILDAVYPAAVNGQWTYAVQDAKGGSASARPPAQNLTALGLNAGFTHGVIARWGGSASLDWTPGPAASAYLRGTYARDTITQDSYYEQIYADGVTHPPIGATGTFGTSINQIRPRFYYSTSPEQALLATAQLGGSVKTGRLTLRPEIFYSAGEYNAPDHQEISARKPNSGPALPYSGSTMFGSADGVPIFLGSAQAYGYLDGIADYNARRSGELSAEFSRQSRVGARLDATLDLGAGLFRTLDVGVKYRDADRHHRYNDYSTGRIFDANGKEVSWSTLGLFDGRVAAVVPGVYDLAAPLISRPALDRLFNGAIAASYGSLAAADDSCGDPNPAIGNVNNRNCNTQSGHERVTSLYAMGTAVVGTVHALVGVRYEHTAITNSYWVLPTDGTGAEVAGGFASSRTIYDKVLPSLQINWRPIDEAVLRASVSRTYMPPAFFQLAGGQRITRSGGGAEAGGTTSITQGNPNLKTMDSTNLDASAEYAGRRLAGSVGLFYKDLDNFFFSQVNNYSNLATEGGATTVSRPMNGGGGHVYGAEIAGSVTLGAAPAVPGDFVLSGNLTVERSRVDPKGGLSPHERLLYQPNLAGNAQLSYVLAGFRADVTYRYSGAYVYQYAVLGGSSALDGWVRPRSLLAFHAGYQFGRARLEAAVDNLAGTRSYYATVGRYSTTLASIVESGRTVTAKVSYRF